VSKRINLLLLVALLAASAQAMPFSPVLEVHLLSAGTGLVGPVGQYEYWKSWGPRFVMGTWMTNPRFLDVALGLRVSPKYAVAAQFILLDGWAGYYMDSEEMPIAFGLTVTRGTRLGPRPKAVVLTATLRGSNQWTFFNEGLKYVDLGVGANITCWAVNPELEIGFRREWDPGVFWPGRYVPPHVDGVYIMARVGLGGWYELESARAKWDRHETGAWSNP
jgi:hypothetical protein